MLYDPLARRFLLRVKLGKRRELLDVLGETLASTLVETGFAEGCDRVVPVPARIGALLVRGFNPARDLARVVSARLGIPLVARALGARGAEPAAKLLNAAARRARAARAFAPRARLDGASVLLVDDVLTTGATADGCARALLGAGARRVRIAIWARTTPPRVV